MSGSFVPVAVNLYKIRQAKDEGGTLFQSVLRQQPQYQGIWIVSPDGKVLAAHHEIKEHARWPQEVLDTIRAGLNAFGPVEPRTTAPANPLPNRGVGSLPDGSVCLALYSRYVRGGGKPPAHADVRTTSLWLWDGALKADGPPVIDTLPLTAAEWAAFSPPALSVGTEWKIPDAIARKLARVLSPSSDQSTMPRPEDALSADLTARVETVEAGTARIRFTGRYATKHVYDGKSSYAWATAGGTATYDLQQKQMTALLITFSGAYRMAPPWDKEDRPIAAVVEWKQK